MRLDSFRVESKFEEEHHYFMGKVRDPNSMAAILGFVSKLFSLQLFGNSNLAISVNWLRLP